MTFGHIHELQIQPFYLESSNSQQFKCCGFILQGRKGFRGAKHNTKGKIFYLIHFDINNY